MRRLFPFQDPFKGTSALEELGRQDMSVVEYVARGGITVHREEIASEGSGAGRIEIEELASALDERRGALFASTCEVPGRYALWDRGFVDPPIGIECRGRRVEIQALNERGAVVLPALSEAAATAPGARILERSPACVHLEVAPPAGRFSEEDRSRHLYSKKVLAFRMRMSYVCFVRRD